MKLRDWIQKSTKKLDQAGIATARLDCLVLLGDALGKDKSWLLAHQEETVQGSTLYSLEGQVERRIKHEPLAYIRGKSEFYGREFTVNNHTLEPRPETETIIDLLKLLDCTEHHGTYTLIDVGTGSGCIAITAQLEFSPKKTYAIDIDMQCLRIAERNAKNHNADISYFKGNLLEPLQGTLDEQDKTIILTNLPYVPDAHTINKAAMHEPSHAIFGGEDGLTLYRLLFSQLMSVLPSAPEYVLTESLPTQHEQLQEIARNHSYLLATHSDFIQVFKRDT